MAAAIQQLNAPLQRQETAVTILTSESESFARQVQSLTATTGTTGQRVRPGVVDTRVIGKPDQFDGGPMKYAEIVRRDRGSAVPARVDNDRSTVDSETQCNPRQRGKRSQHTDVLNSRDDNCRSRVGQVSLRRRERRVRGLEAVRDGVGAQASNEVRGTLDECAGVPIQRRHSNQAGGVPENRARLREPINKDRRRRHQDRRDDD